MPVRIRTVGYDCQQRITTAMKTISLKIPEHLDARLDKLVKQRGNAGKSQLVREAIEHYVDRETPVRSASVLEGMLDLIGKYSGPGDLATNPEYMEGFGSDRVGDRRRRPARRRA